MRRRYRISGLASVTVVALMVLASFAMATGGAGKDDKVVTVIVTFKDKVDEDLIKEYGGKVVMRYDIFPGVVLKVKASKIDDLGKEGKVKAVEMDATASLPIDAVKGKKKPTPPPPPEFVAGVQWGVDRIDADLVWGDDDVITGEGIKVAVLDTGIDYNHQELSGIYKGGYDFINDDDNPMDDNGHGTHCAGIIAANSDPEGVVGVAYGVDLYAVKVLDSGGSGAYSVIIDGINWAVNNVDYGDYGKMDVISMSLSGRSGSTALEAACDAAQDAGIVIVCAAGNAGRRNVNANTVQYPALYDSTIAVGATDSSDARASFSSTGTGLDLVAPGVDIWSTFVGGGYKLYSGTSMACPHVAGTVALMLTQTVPDAYDDEYSDYGDNDGFWDPIEVLDCLVSTADDLGKAGWDNAYGWGIVDAEEAVTGTGTAD